MGNQIALFSPFKELYESYSLVYEQLKVIAIDLVNEVISKHVKYLEEQQAHLGQAIKVQRTRGIPFLQQEIAKILNSVNSSS